MRHKNVIINDIALLTTEIEERNQSTERKNNHRIYWLLVQSLDECIDELTQWLKDNGEYKEPIPTRRTHNIPQIGIEYAKRLKKQHRHY